MTELEEYVRHAEQCEWCYWHGTKLYSLRADGWKPALLADGTPVERAS